MVVYTPMVTRRLKVDPEAIDLMLTAVVLARRDKAQHAGHYAFLALGRVISKSLTDEEGDTNPVNLSRRIERLCDEQGFPEEWRDQLFTTWNRISYYLYSKVSYIPPYRSRQIKAFVEFVKYVLEEQARIKFEEILASMTREDLERLHQRFGDALSSPREQA